MRWIRRIAIGLAALVVVVVTAIVILTRTNWFREYVREKIIAAIEESTGGTTEIASFTFDLSQLHAHLTGLVIHGREPAGSAPFVRVGAVDLYARAFAGGHLVGISALKVEAAQVNIQVAADGSTNLPVPRRPSSSKTTPLETMVDLAVGQFELRDSVLNYNSRQQPLELRANNLHAQLWYHLLEREYQGQLSLEPLYVAAGQNVPVRWRVALPVVLERDRIRLNGARLETADSAVQIDGSVQDLRQPRFTAHARGKIALADLKRTSGLPLELRPGAPSSVALDANLTGSADRVEVSLVDIAVGHSKLHASGVLKDPRGAAGLLFQGDLALAEIMRLAGLNAHLDGNVALKGEARLDANDRPDISGALTSSNLAFTNGNLRLRQAGLSTDVRWTPERLELNSLRLMAFGGKVDATATLENAARYTVHGNIGHLDLHQVLMAIDQALPYNGTVSGTWEANGDLHTPGTRSLEGRTALAIAPAHGGTPLEGRLDAEYSGAQEDVNVRHSYLELPQTRLTISGSLQHRLEISLTTRNLRELPVGAPPVTLTGGQAAFTGALTGGLQAPRIAGHVAVNHFQVQGRLFDALGADIAASGSGAAVQQGLLTRGTLQASFSAAVGLRGWKPLASSPLSADADVQNGDLADILVLAGQNNDGFAGALTAQLHAAGTIGNPIGSAGIHIVHGTLEDTPFDSADAQVNLSDQLASIPSATLTAGNARVALTGEFRHPRDSFTTGQIHARLQTNAIDLAQARALEKQLPNTGGSIEMTAEATGDLGKTEFLLTSIQADASARAIRYQAQPYGDFQLHVRTRGQAATLSVVSDFAGSSIHVEGTTQLVPGYPTTADAQMRGLAVERMLPLVHHADIPVRGKLALDAHVRGTLKNPEGDVTLDLAGASVYQEPIDRLHAQIRYLARRLELSDFEAASGTSHIALSASFDHPAGTLNSGTAQFRLQNSSVDLARLHNVQQMRPGLAGSVQFSADGSASIVSGSPRILLTQLNANLATSGLAVDRTPVGNLNLTAHTAAGSRLDFTLQSDLAGSTIQASGNGQLGGDYPANVQFRFANLHWMRLAPLLGSASAGSRGSFDAAAEGGLSVNGPILHPDQLHSSLTLSRLAVQTLPQPGGRNSTTIQNQGPVAATLDRGTLRLDSFHLAGSGTDIQAGGTVGVYADKLDLTVNAGADLAVLSAFNRDLVASGRVRLTTAVRGTTSNPQANGQLELQNASVNDADFPTGLSNANGVILLRGSRATIQNLTAESGGGQVALTGFAGMAGSFRFALRAKASAVRMRVQEGVRVMLGADLHLGGSTAGSTASGTVTLQQLDYAPRSDLGSILQRAAPSVENRATPSALLDNMKLDLRVRTTPATRVQTSLAENLAVDADLRVSGSASQPAVLGRIDLTEGQLVFFGSTYTLNTGSISFFNPVRIDPILNLSLETQTQGVDVTLNVTGPVDNMKLTYTSNPPLQFQEIIGLLSTGATPTSDPTLLANQPTPPSQSFEQRGESAILGQAVANPVASRLQRVFGVSQLKIDPAFTGSSQLPTAQVTLQQQVSPKLTFTYVSALDDPNSTLVRAEWALNSRWSALAIRDQNGVVSINLLYKRQFR